MARLRAESFFDPTVVMEEPADAFSDGGMAGFGYEFTNDPPPTSLNDGVVRYAIDEEEDFGPVSERRTERSARMYLSSIDRRYKILLFAFVLVGLIGVIVLIVLLARG
nr:hypothetical protein [Sicyoidochytrium minutum DNA virus]